jgi:triphosphatase
MHETELKFQVPAACRAALLKAVATAGAATTRLRAVYADTPDQRLAAAGMALRLRQEGRVWVQTLKGRGDGLMQRLEHEVRLPPQPGVPALDPRRHEGTPAGAALQAALQDAGPLQPVYRTDIQRLHRRLRHGGAVIEIALDRGHILAGERRLPVHEIEFELVRGPAAALPTLAARWAARHGLWWDVRTKSERGFRLALGLDTVPAVAAERAGWAAPAGPAQVFRATLQAALAHALPNLAELAGGSGGPEHLHQLRVALRRLRTALALLSPWAGAAAQAEAVALQAAWRAPFALLGATREADVLAQAWRPRLAVAQAPGFAWPPHAAAAEPGGLLRDPAVTALLLRTLALSMEPVADLPAVGTAAPVAQAAQALLRPLWRRARRDARAFDAATPAQQHATRKRLKRLRYALEFLQPALKPKATRQALAVLRRALDALGDLNDLRAAEASFRALAVQEPTAWFAAGQAAGLCEAARARAGKRLVAVRHLKTS